MINVYSFQKMTQIEESSDDKNISKTSQFIFGQNYKKLVTNTKASFDFRKFLQKHPNTRKHFATLANKQTSKRNVLEDVSSSQLNNQHVTLQSKAFKIRCFSRKVAKQNEKQEQISSSKLIKCKPKIYPIKQQKISQKTTPSTIDPKKCIKLHKFDNFEELEPISSSIKIVYNNFISQSDNITDKAVIFDLPYLIGCVKSFNVKNSQKDREFQHFKKKTIFLIKRIIQQKYSQIGSQRTIREKPQIIFKVRKEQEISQLMKTLQQCEFDSFYCIFSIQNKHIQSASPYNLMKINNLAQNIFLIDSIENLVSYTPLINSQHFIGFCTFSQKSNLGNALQILFYQLQNLEINFSADQFDNEDPINGHIFQIPHKLLIEKVRQRKDLKNLKKLSRQKKQRCHSSYDNPSSSRDINQRKYEQKSLENFKQKILKYLKIIESQNNIQSKKSRQIQTSTQEELRQCFTIRQKCCKTNNQIVSQLIKLNSHIHKQITSYQRKMEEVELNFTKQEKPTFSSIKFQKIFVNSLN